MLCVQLCIIKFELTSRLKAQRGLLGSALNVSAVNVSRAPSYPSFNPKAAPSIIKNHLSAIHRSAERNWSMEESLAKSSCQALLVKLSLETSAHKKKKQVP